MAFAAGLCLRENTVVGQTLALITIIGLTVLPLVSVQGQFIGYPQISPVSPTVNQQVSFTVTATANSVTFSVYSNAPSNFCDTDWTSLSSLVTLTASHQSGNVWSATLPAGVLFVGLYGFITYAYYGTGFGAVGAPMCSVFRVRAAPIPEFWASSIVLAVAVGLSTLILRRRRSL